MRTAGLTLIHIMEKKINAGKEKLKKRSQPFEWMTVKLDLK